MSARILVFAGSARRDSLNKKLARAAAGFAREAGGEVAFIDLDDYPMPVYHGDLEAAEGMPWPRRSWKPQPGSTPEKPSFLKSEGQDPTARRRFSSAPTRFVLPIEEIIKFNWPPEPPSVKLSK